MPHEQASRPECGRWHSRGYLPHFDRSELAQFVARMVQNSLLHFDSDRYRLSAWVVMPNHVHLLATPYVDHSLSEIMHSFKSYTAHEANKLLRRSGQFWMEDYFDRYIRDGDHFEKTVAYIENNPVKAGLCKKPSDWPFSSAWFRARRK